MRRRAALLAIPTTLAFAGHALAQAPASASTSLLPIVANSATLAAHIGYGANAASASHSGYLSNMGFDWGKGFLRLTPSLGANQDFSGADNQLQQFLAHGIRRVLIRIDAAVPPPDDAARAGFAAAAASLARHVRTSWTASGLERIAYEVWNEPNLDYEWRGNPNPALYTALLRAAYAAIKAADRDAIVVTGGLATTGDGAPNAYGDLAYLREMYENGAKGHFDALGSHPYGGPCAPEDKRGVLCFRRAEDQRQVMLEYGDAQRQVWATEFGWIVATGGCDLGEHQSYAVSEATQADYLVRAYRYADARWPWMGAMFVFCLDFGAVNWYQYCDPVRWYSILYRTNPIEEPGTPIVERRAYAALRDMAKRYAG